MILIYFLIASSIPLIAFGIAQVLLSLANVHDVLEGKLFLFVVTILFHVIIITGIFYLTMYSHKLF